jgi:hypothetical protein
VGERYDLTLHPQYDIKIIKSNKLIVKNGPNCDFGRQPKGAPFLSQTVSDDDQTWHDFAVGLGNSTLARSARHHCARGSFVTEFQDLLIVLN